MIRNDAITKKTQQHRKIDRTRARERERQGMSGSDDDVMHIRDVEIANKSTNGIKKAKK